MWPLNGRFIALATVGIIVAIVSVAPARKSEACPDICVCDMWYKLRRATCVNRNLYSIQTGVSNTVQALDLSNNLVSSLGDLELAKTGLKELRYLNLSGNSINSIAFNAFDDLQNLSVLDLSRNHLNDLSPDTFTNSKSLQILRLDGNNFNTGIPQLRSIYITILSMSKCQIAHIFPRSFIGLTGLQSLDLSKNLLIKLDIQILQPMEFLRNLTLYGNPWKCNDDMKKLQVYAKDKQITLDDVCQQKTQPRKFEKMISIVKNDELDDMNNDDDSAFWITDSPTSTQCPDLNENTVTDSSDMLTRGLKKISPYWIFACGILIGSTISLVLTYIWVSSSKSISCNLPNIRRRDIRATQDTTSQRASLLHNWQYEADHLTGTETPTCPGTPPPPYRDVILHSGLYPSVPTATIVGGNITNVRAQRI